MRFSTIALAAVLNLPTLAVCSPILSNVATQSGGTFINFEGQTNGANADNLYSGLGVAFSSTAGNTRIWNPPLAGNQVANSGIGVMGPSAANTDPISIIFSVGQSFAEFFFADPNVFAGTSYTITAYDAADAILESLMIPVTSLPGTYFTGFTRTSADMRRIAIDPSAGGENFSIDDLRFGATAVPEPSSIAIVALGLTLLIRRRTPA